jgi:hypothetical protein
MTAPALGAMAPFVPLVVRELSRSIDSRGVEALAGVVAPRLVAELTPAELARFVALADAVRARLVALGVVPSGVLA